MNPTHNKTIAVSPGRTQNAYVEKLIQSDNETVAGSGQPVNGGATQTISHFNEAQPSSSATNTTKLPEGAEYREGILLYRGCPVDQMMAYPLRIACRVLGISYTVLWEEIKLRKIRMTDRKLISRKEIERYLSEQSKDEN